MTETTEHPWPFEGRVPLLVNDEHVGWIGPVTRVEIGDVDPAEDVEVVEVEFHEDDDVWSMFVEGQQAVLAPEHQEALSEWRQALFHDAR